MRGPGPFTITGSAESAGEGGDSSAEKIGGKKKLTFFFFFNDRHFHLLLSEMQV